MDGLLCERGGRRRKFLNYTIAFASLSPLRYCALQVEEERPSTRQRNDSCVPLLERYPDGSSVQGPPSRVQTSHKASSSTVYVRGLASILADEEVHMAFLPAHRSSAINHAAPSPNPTLLFLLSNGEIPLLSPSRLHRAYEFLFVARVAISLFFQVQLVANVATQFKVNLA